MPPVSFARRLTDLAGADPDRPAVTCGDDRLTRSQLDQAANALARELAGRGSPRGDMVTLALPNSVDWFVTAAAAWKLGAIPQPVSARLPTREMRAIVDLAGPLYHNGPIVWACQALLWGSHVVVIGLPDEDTGGRVHAIVEADPGEVSEDELLTFTRERLAGYEVPARSSWSTRCCATTPARCAAASCAAGG